MSTIKADTIVASDGSSPVTLTKQSAAKAWVNFDGTSTTADIRDSFSVSGVADNGTGDYTVTVSSAFGNANYCCGSTAQQNTGGGRGDFFTGLHSTAQTTTTRRISICDSGGTATDGLIGNLQIWGDLA